VANEGDSLGPRPFRYQVHEERQDDQYAAQGMIARRGDDAEEECDPDAGPNEAVAGEPPADGAIKQGGLALRPHAEAPRRRVAQRNEATLDRCAVGHATRRPREVEDVHLVATWTLPPPAVGDEIGAAGRARPNRDRQAHYL